MCFFPQDNIFSPGKCIQDANPQQVFQNNDGVLTLACTCVVRAATLHLFCMPPDGHISSKWTEVCFVFVFVLVETASPRRQREQKLLIYMKTQTCGCFLDWRLPGSCVLGPSSSPHHPCDQSYLGYLNRQLLSYSSGPQIYQS